MASRLMERDWNLILSSLHRLLQVEDIDSLVSDSLEFINYLVPATQIVFTRGAFNRDGTSESWNMAVIGDPARYQDVFMSGDYSNDPIFRGWNLLKETTVARDTDLMPESFRINTSLYRDVYQPQGIHYALRAVLFHKQQYVGDISLFNSREKGDFTDRDVSAMEKVAPFIATYLGRLAMNEKTRLGDFASKYNLTSREHELLELVVDGVPDSEIADRLCISKATFKKHIHNIYSKTGAANRTQLYSMTTKG